MSCLGAVLGKSVLTKPMRTKLLRFVRFATCWATRQWSLWRTLPVAVTPRFISKRGEGIMHIGLNVDSARDVIGRLKDTGYALISDPEQGDVLPSALGGEYGFVHPKALNGVLVEIADCG